MPKSASVSLRPLLERTAEAPPVGRSPAEVHRHWQDRVVERALARAQASPGDRRSRESIVRRALRPAMQMVAAAEELTDETSSYSFTIQDVLVRSNGSLRTFYRHFSGKDDLLLAVLEETVAGSTEELEGESAAPEDPVAQIEHVVKGPFRRRRRGRPLLVREHLKLMESRPADVYLADLPFALLLKAKIQAAQERGRLPGVDPEEQATLMSDLVKTRFYACALGTSPVSLDAEADRVWRFCLAALRRNELRP